LPAAVASTDQPDNSVLLITSRVAVGAREALKKIGSAANPPDWNRLDRAAITPWDQIDEAIISAELYRPSDAADRLSALLRSGSLGRFQTHLAQSLRAAYRTGKPPSRVLTPIDVGVLKTQGWYADLALGQGLPDTDPARHAPLDSAARSFIIGAVVLVIFMALGFIGGGLIIIAFVYLTTRRVKWAFVPPPPGVVYLETFVLYLAILSLSSLLLILLVRAYDIHPTTAWLWALTPVLLLAFFWPALSEGSESKGRPSSSTTIGDQRESNGPVLSGSTALTTGETPASSVEPRSESKGVMHQGSFSRSDALPDEADFGSGLGVTTSSIEQIRRGEITPPAAKSREYGSWRSVRQSLGWHRGRGVWTEIAVGVLSYIGYLPILLLTAIISAAISQGKSLGHPIVPELMHAHGTPLVLIILAAVVAAPVMEETFFRGALFAHLRSRWRWLVAGPLVGFIFAAIHPQGWTAIPVLGGIGIFLCALREWRSSLIAPMTAHALNNLAILSLLLIVR
jgi:membrane protease YdiL (CAAX protease family)